MAENTAIEWAHHTFNPWIGCQKVGPACEHCYAETLATARLGVEWGPGAPRRRTATSTWLLPRRWDRRAAELGIRYRVFCASLADVFDNAVDPTWRYELAVLIARTPHLDWLLLTKRIGNARSMLFDMFKGRVQPNVWLGATIATQEEADRDIPKLLATPAAKRFLSMEPLLGPVDLTRLCQGVSDGVGPWAGRKVRLNVDGLRGAQSIGWPPLDWIIVGGESGPGARPMHPEWVISLRDQCEGAGVPFLFKQWGEHLPVYVVTASRTGVEYRRVGKKAAGRRLQGVTHDAVPA